MSHGLHLPEEIRVEVTTLTEACLRNDITVEELARLEILIRGNPAALQEYLNYVVQSACLARWADAAEASVEDRAPPDLDIDQEYLQRLLSQSSRQAPPATLANVPPPVERGESSLGLRGLIQEYSRQPLAAAILALVMIFGGVLAWNLSRLPTPPVVQQSAPLMKSPRSELPQNGELNSNLINQKSELSNRTVARLKSTIGATWQQPLPPSDGSALAAGQELVLQQGLAEIFFDTGATVILEGPAELVVGIGGRESGVGGQGSAEASEIHNSRALRLGKLAVTVPVQAHGFTVRTPSMKITDLGTAFGVEVKSRNSSRPSSSQLPATSSTTEVQVFLGEVNITPASAVLAQAPAAKTSTILKAGEGVITQPEGGSPQAITAVPAKFVREMPVEGVAANGKPGDTGFKPMLRPGDILAVSRHTLKLVKIDPKTGEQTILARGEHGIHGTDWMCVGVDAQGRAVVGTDGPADGGCRVLRIDPRDGSIRVLASGGLLTQGRVTALAIAADGMVFATLDGLEDKVLKINPRTGAVSEVAQFGNNAWGIAIDIRGHDLIAVSDGTGAVARLSGKSISPWTTGSDTEGARGVAVRPDGRVFISIYSDPGRKIVEIDRHSHRVTDIAVLPPQPDAILGLLAVEPNGNLIVGSYGGQGRVYRIDVAKGTATLLSSDGHLEASGGVAVVPPQP